MGTRTDWVYRSTHTFHRSPIKNRRLSKSVCNLESLLFIRKRGVAVVTLAMANERQAVCNGRVKSTDTAGF